MLQQRIFNYANLTTAGMIVAWSIFSLPASAANFQFDMSQMQEVQAVSAVPLPGNSGGATGARSRKTYRTGSGPMSIAPNQSLVRTGKQTRAISLQTSTAGLAPVFGASGLPPTSLDSFVMEAGGNADAIYGDEGTDDIPPYFGFDQSHRINIGISGDDAGLTTGHGSVLPNAWGGDEFVQTEGWTMSGANGGNPYGPGYGYGSAAGGGEAGIAGGDLGGLGGALQGSNWAQNHPRQNEVLTSDSVLYNQINSSYGSLNGRYNILANRAVWIQSEDLSDATANGGYITANQQAQMDQEVKILGRAMDKSINQASTDSGF